MTLNVAMPDTTKYVIGGNASIAGFAFAGFKDALTGAGTLTVTSPSGGCVSNCSALVTGFFAGSAAERAGLGYHIEDLIAGKDVLGAAAFKKQ
jgi:hypothetical protein